jgi:hypothetical protein
MNNIENGIDGIDTLVSAINVILGSTPQGLSSSIASRLAITDMAWVRLALTGTFVSATSFTVAGDLTAFLKLPAKLRVVNSTTKYGYVFSSTYSSGTGLTTVNLVANTDYSLVSGAITNIDVSYGNPADFPGGFNWTPTQVGNAILSGYDQARFTINGRFVDFSFYAGNRSLSGTAGTIKTTLPVIPSAVGIHIRASAQFFLTSNGIYTNILCAITPSQNYMEICKDFTSAGWLATETGLYMQIHDRYEI